MSHISSIRKVSRLLPFETDRHSCRSQIQSLRISEPQLIVDATDTITAAAQKPKR